LSIVALFTGDVPEDFEIKSIVFDEVKGIAHNRCLNLGVVLLAVARLYR
jgi:hypothetical protein